jgi:carbon storage regulator
MLIVSRKKNERIYVGASIVIQVTDLGGDRVWIGIKAPDDVKIFREEVLLAMLARERSGIPRAGKPLEAPADAVADGQTL